MKTTLKQKISLILFGLFLCAVIIETTLWAASFIYISLIERRNRISLKKGGGEYRIMCLGESTTAEGGWSFYPYELGRILREKIPRIRLSIINKGMPGVDTNFILAELDENLKTYRPHMVIVMMGVNDNDKDMRIINGPVGMKSFIKKLRFYKLMVLFSKRMHESEILKDELLWRGDFALGMKDYTKAKKLFEEAIKICPRAPGAYICFGNYYLAIQDYTKSEDMFKQAIKLAPHREEAYTGLGLCYKASKQSSLAEEYFIKAIENNPNKETAYIELANLYRERGSFSQAETLLKKAIKIAPDDGLVNVALARLYDAQEKFSEGKKMLKEAIKKGPILDVYSEITQYFQQHQQYPQAEAFLKEMKDRLDNRQNITIENFRKLKEIVLRQGIMLVFVQYPLRRIEELKKMFYSSEGATFVDNYAVFLEATGKEGYEKYFCDRFSGDFGHCSIEGNRLLANNIAEAILKENLIKIK